MPNASPQPFEKPSVPPLKVCARGGFLGFLSRALVNTLWLAGAFALDTRAASIDPEGVAFFESRIRPVLLKQCFECHSAQKTKGGLRLDYRGGFEKGGESGDLLDREHPENSLLLQTIRHDAGDLKMPKGEARLSDGVIADLTRWVRMGLPGIPDKPLTAEESSQQAWSQKLAERRMHWAWLPVQSTTPPQVQHPAWTEHAVDRFLFAKMQQAGLTPAPPASREILLRRLKIALLGLPPTPEEVEAFLNDTRPRALERLVDRFLKDPAFGENWAAHWLDLMRFGETGGYVRDYPIPEAWRYRDYVIRAFNQDVPYDRFVQEHIAGDLLPPRINQELKINESLIGTGCMRLMEVSSTATDVALEEAQMLENQIDTLGKAFQGMTIACARCHDHKFDAISTRDYYGIFGALASSRQSQSVIDTLEVRRTGVAELQTLKGQIKSALEKVWKEDIQQQGVALKAVLDSEPAANAEPNSVWNRLLKREKVDMSDPLYPLWTALKNKGSGNWRLSLPEAQANLAQDSKKRADENKKAFNVIADFSGGNSGWHLSGVLPETVQQSASDFVLAPSGEELVERIVAPGIATDRLSRKHGAVVRSPDFKLETQYVSLKVAGGDAGHVRLIQHNFQQMENIAQGYKVAHFENRFSSWVTVKVGHQRSWQGRRSYLEILTKDDVAHFRRSEAGGNFFKMTAKDQTGRSWFEVEQIVEHESPSPPQDELRTPLLFLPPAGESPLDHDWAGLWKAVCDTALEHWMQDKALPEEVTLLNWLIAEGVIRNQIGKLPKPLKELASDYRKLEESLPKFQRAATLAQEGPGFDAPIQRRGSPDSPSEPAPRRYLEVVCGADCNPAESSSRLSLAKDLVSPRNPLTARVMVNRVWRWIFGQGIVGTVDNFGSMGEKPTHPELLDHLATYFVEQGWSMKELIRYLVTTQAYRTASSPSEEAQKKDPANRLLSHMPLQRLRAEAVRDSLLAVSGQLNPLMYGYTGPSDLGNGLGPPNQRRGVYQYIKREAQNHLMVMFDAPEPSRTQGSRDSSNVPGQSLLLLNNDFVHEQARVWAERSLRDAKGISLDQRTERLFFEALGRRPLFHEIQTLVAFVQEQADAYQIPHDAQTSDHRLWTDVCHVLLNTKEFLYIP